MENRIRVQNMTKYNIGIRLMNGMERNIAPGVAIQLPPDDVEYIMQLAPKLFAPPCKLKVYSEELNEIFGIAETPTTPSSDKEYIRKKLRGKTEQVKAWLSENHDGHMIEAICEVAKEMDLPASKMKLVEAMVPAKIIE